MPHCNTKAVARLLNNFIHLMKGSSTKPKRAKVEYKNFHDTESMAFQKSINMIIPGMLYFSLKSITS